MPLIDDRGRVFGRVNLIDALVAVVALVLVPLAYGAFLLFRVPMPKITAVTPAEIAEGQEITLQITGEGLRPFLVPMVGGGAYVSRAFLLQSPTRAEVKLPPLPVGTYELTLSEGGQVVARQSDAFKVVAPSVGWLDVQAVGAFVGLTDATAGLIGAALKFGSRSAVTASPVAEVLALRAPEPLTERVKIGEHVFATVSKPGVRVPAIIRLSCAVTKQACAVGGIVVAPSTTVTLPLATSAGSSGPPGPDRVTFAIDQVFPAGIPAAFPAVATVRVRFVAGTGVLNAMKAGDVDIAGQVGDDERAVLMDVGSDPQPTTAEIRIDGVPGRSWQFVQPAMTFVGTVRVPVVSTPSGWSYNSQSIKAGAVFAFESRAGAIAGWIVDVRIDPEKPRLGR